MALFTVMRKQFVDRPLDTNELTALTDMLWLWWCRRVSSDNVAGVVQAEAIIYCFPRPEIDSLRQAVTSAATTPLTLGENSDNELVVAGPALSGETAPDLAAWQAVLATPAVESACVRLQLSFEGSVVSYDRRPGEGRTTFVLIGTTTQGNFELKTLWKNSRGDPFNEVHKKAAWPEEANLLEALRIYTGHRDHDAHEAATFAWRAMGKPARQLFTSDRDRARVLKIVRRRVELRDERGPAAFARRVGVPLLVAIAITAIAFQVRSNLTVALLCVTLAVIELYKAVQRFAQKVAKVRRYYTRMRAGLGKLHSSPVKHRPIDLSQDRTPTLRKCTIELEALGATLIGDVGIDTAKQTFDGNRIFHLGTASVALLMLRKTEAYLFFPPKPILAAVSLFDTQMRHQTINQPRYRHLSRQDVSIRCTPDEVTTVELLEVHERCIAKRVAAGAKILPPPKTLQEHLDWMQKDNEQARIEFQRSPYSWSDAMHDAFKVCRREFLRD